MLGLRRFIELGSHLCGNKMYLLVLFALLPSVAGAQFKLSDAETPAAPGFMILGIEPKSIDRPTSPKDLTISILSSAAREKFVPIAIEFAPYWLIPQPALRADTYYEPDLVQSLKQTCTLSIAAAKQDSPQTGTNFGFGVKFQPVPGKTSTKTDSLRRMVRTSATSRALLLNLESNIEADSLPEFLCNAKEKRNEYLASSTDTLVVNRAYTVLEQAIKDITVRRSSKKDIDPCKEVKELKEDLLKRATRPDSAAIRLSESKRVGLKIEMAGAAVFGFPQRRFCRIGAWTTLSYTPDNSTKERLATARYIWDNEKDCHLVDVGGRIIFCRRGPVAVSGEVLWRFKNKDPLRVVGIFEYTISKDLYLTAVIGKDFDGGPDRRNIISVVGLNIGLSKERKVE